MLPFKSPRPQCSRGHLRDSTSVHVCGHTLMRMMHVNLSVFLVVFFEHVRVIPFLYSKHVVRNSLGDMLRMQKHIRRFLFNVIKQSSNVFVSSFVHTFDTRRRQQQLTHGPNVVNAIKSIY